MRRVPRKRRMFEQSGPRPRGGPVPRRDPRPPQGIKINTAFPRPPQGASLPHQQSATRQRKGAGKADRPERADPRSGGTGAGAAASAGHAHARRKPRAPAPERSGRGERSPATGQGSGAGFPGARAGRAPHNETHAGARASRPPAHAGRPPRRGPPSGLAIPLILCQVSHLLDTLPCLLPSDVVSWYRWKRRFSTCQKLTFWSGHLPSTPMRKAYRRGLPPPSRGYPPWGGCARSACTR